MATSRNVLSNTQTVDSITSLVSSTDIGMMRPIQIIVRCGQIKPNTRFYPFFDGRNIDEFCQIGDGTGISVTVQGNLKSDDAGDLVFRFNVPANTFSTGTKEFFLTERPTLTTVKGDQFCRASATFTSRGILERFQTVRTTTTNTVIEEVTRREVRIQSVMPPSPSQIETPPQPWTWADATQEELRAAGVVPRVDPLAQSFFTFGVPGGCFITSVDLYFQRKDDTLPVMVDVRELVNGYPSPVRVDKESFMWKPAADITISDNASAVTNFKFNKPIRLEAEKEYCFVVFTTQTNYNLWCSRMSEISNETGKVIFQQPYVGSLFKSENNLTWDAEQYEDIKFTLYKAAFNKDVQSNLIFSIHPKVAAHPGAAAVTLDGSNTVYFRCNYRHGLDIGSKIGLSCDTRGMYNGVAGSVMNGEHEVVAIRGEYDFIAAIPGATFNQTDTFGSNGVIRQIQVDSNGSGYSTASPPSILITNSIGTVLDITSSCTLTIEDGKLMSVQIGEGVYNAAVVGDAVTATVSGGAGTGATIHAFTDTKFGLLVNRVFHEFSPTFLDLKEPSGTKITSTLHTTLADYETGVAQNYTTGGSYDVRIQNADNRISNSNLLVSRINEIHKMSGNLGAKLEVVLASNNVNVSPYIDLDNAYMTFFGNIVNDLARNKISDQVIEDTEVQVLTGEVTSVNILDGGTGYGVAPSVVIEGPGFEDATATATISGGAVTGVTIVTGGKYVDVPVVRFVGTSTTVAKATANISKFNSELNPGDGSARCRYITRKQTLKHTSNAIRILFTAYSNYDSNVDFYIKTSLSADSSSHNANEWQLVDNTKVINKSTRVGEFIEYELNKTGMPQFDVFNLKIVIRTKTPWDPPVISDYRCIVLAA